MGAGIMPVARDACGTLRVLLAKEQYVHAWRGSHKWSAFEGGRKAGESVAQAAAREWREESIDSLWNLNSEELEKGNFVCKFTLCLADRRDLFNDPRRFHVMYIVEVDHDMAAPQRFAHRRAQITAFANAVAEHTKCGRELMCVSRDERVVDARWAQGADGGDAVLEVHVCGTRDAGVRRTVVVQASKARHWLQLGDVIKTNKPLVRRYLPASSVYVHLANDSDIVCAAWIAPDYLEKDSVRWWTLAELRSVIMNGGKLRENNFRTFFLPVLHACVTFLTQYDKLN